jgi:predicted ABC-type ATPase
MGVKRLRIFAGPNGSGKTTIINRLRDSISFGVYINADDIERAFMEQGYIDLKEFQINTTTTKLKKHFLSTDFSQSKFNNTDIWENLSVKKNKICTTDKKQINSYIAADIAEFIRQSLLETGISFSFETVMSHSSKLDFITKARQKGYKVYLYYIATEDPEINNNRTKIRVALNGHKVSPKKVTDRYYRSLSNLKTAVKLTNRAYIFDNSGKVSILISEITGGTSVRIIDQKEVPNWFIKYLVD